MSAIAKSAVQAQAQGVASRARSGSRAAALRAAVPSARRVRCKATEAVAAGEDTVIEAAGKMISVGSDGTIVISTDGNGSGPAPSSTEVEYLTGRSALVTKHFEGSLGADDFVQRVEMALYAYGFTGENSIAMVNLCRDEVTVTLKQKIDAVYGASFSTNGLGGVLTCGAIGMGAGFSHSPIDDNSGKERYIFFSFPHISINSRGEVGPMSRPGRPGQSCACGALIAATNQLTSEGVSCNCKIPGMHDPVNPEYTILKQRIARRMRHEGITDESVKSLTLVDVTKIAERTISDDLEFLISKTVDTNKADYAVITGVQIHNWAFDFEDDAPNLEFVYPTSAYVVVNGTKTHLDLQAMPPLTPRQINLLHGGDASVACNTGGASTLRAEDPPTAADSKEARRAQKKRLQSYISLIKEEGLESVAKVPGPPAFASKIAVAAPARCASADNSTILSKVEGDAELKKLQDELNKKFQALA